MSIQFEDKSQPVVDVSLRREEGDIGLRMIRPSEGKGSLLVDRRRSKSRPADAVRVRVGVHTGEVIRQDDGDIFGKHVILAARIAGTARGGEILVSSLVRELVEARGDLQFGEPRPVSLKGLDGAHVVHPVQWLA